MNLLKILITIGLLAWLWWQYSTSAEVWRQKRAAKQRLDRARILTRSYLDSLPDDRLADAVYDHVLAALDAKDASNYEPEIVGKLSQGKQYVYATRILEDEVMNGGFVQLFCNSSRQLVPMALEGYIAFGAKQHAIIVKQAMKIYEQSVPKRDQFSSAFDAWDWFSQHPDVANTLAALDDPLYDVPHGKQFDSVRGRYIRTHLDEFVSDAPVATKQKQ